MCHLGKMALSGLLLQHRGSLEAVAGIAFFKAKELMRFWNA